MPIWTVRFCQLLPPPAAKLHWLQAIQLPHTPGAKRKQAANVASSGWAGLEPGWGRMWLLHSSQGSGFSVVLFVCAFIFFFWSFTVGCCWGHHPFPGNGSKTCWSFFLCLLCSCLASSVFTCCLHAVISRKCLELQKTVPSLRLASPAPTLSPHP